MYNGFYLSARSESVLPLLPASPPNALTSRACPMDTDSAASPPRPPALPNITIADATRAFRPKSLALGCAHPAAGAPALGRYEPVNCSVRVTGRRRTNTTSAAAVVTLAYTAAAGGSAATAETDEGGGGGVAALAAHAPMERLAFWAGMPALAQLTFEVRSAPVAAAADLCLVAVVLDDFAYDIVAVS